jgi:Protein of unknown function (DUF3040)
MSLSAREQQALDSTEDELAGSDPKLASLLATFARHASGQEMPAREKIPNPALRRGNVRRPAHRLFPRLGLQQTMLLLWLTVTIALIAVALVLNRDSRNGPCPESRAVACTQQAPVHSPRPAAHKTSADQVRRATEATGWLTTSASARTASWPPTGENPHKTHLMIGTNP